ncbi:hypothetical protein [Mesorhizobium sp. LNHC229A00]|uniref:hypothetical protein n=1 Tax=Mesorhizobium sp. LNHC229A00 TaxID=1287240 RepID=UPI0018DE31BD|nr:hypothetical protein [Mesorhizobium sp. LNHC229A00]
MGSAVVEMLRELRIPPWGETSLVEQGRFRSPQIVDGEWLKRQPLFFRSDNVRGRDPGKRRRCS